MVRVSNIVSTGLLISRRERSPVFECGYRVTRKIYYATAKEGGKAAPESGEERGGIAKRVPVTFPMIFHYQELFRKNLCGLRSIRVRRYNEFPGLMDASVKLKNQNLTGVAVRRNYNFNDDHSDADSGTRLM